MITFCEVRIQGNAGVDAELSYMPSGGAAAKLRIATSKRWKDKDSGEMKSKTEWHNVVLFNRLAEIAGQYVKKGMTVYVAGELRTRKWQGQDGQDRYITEIVANELQFDGGDKHRADATPAAATSQAGGEWDDDIPF